MRGAIIGLGNVALNGHLPGWQKVPDFQIVAGADSDAGRRELFQKALPGAASAASMDELPKDLDFVDVCTPPHTHYAIARAALERGWHVLCEKPLVLSEAEASELDQLSRRQGKVLFTVHNWKYAPLCRKIGDIVRSGVLGEVKHCAWYVLRNGPSVTTDPDNWRLDPKKSGGGILVDHGWHAFYLVMGWLGLRPASVQASLENRQYEDLPVEDTAVIKLKFQDNGRPAPTAEIFLTWASRLRRNWGVIEGSAAQLNIEDDRLEISAKGAPSEKFQFEAGLSQGSHHPDWFEFVAREFAGELSDASKRGANMRDARLCLRLIEQSKLSSEQKAALPV